MPLIMCIATVCTCIPYRRALSSGRCRGSSATSFQFIFVTDCQPHWLSTGSTDLFPVAAARVWNSLPDLVTSTPSIAIFQSWLKIHLFNISYPSPLWLYSACDVTISCFGHYNRSSLLTYGDIAVTWLYSVEHSEKVLPTTASIPTHGISANSDCYSLVVNS